MKKIFFLIILFLLIFCYFTLDFGKPDPTYTAFAETPLIEFHTVPKSSDIQESSIRNPYECSYYTLSEIQNMPAYTFLPKSRIAPDMLRQLFYSTEITSDIEARIRGISYPDDAKIPLSDLRYLRVLHYDIHENIYIGELIVNQKIVDAVVDILWKLFEQQYPIEKMILIDAYEGDDIASMEDNNTSSFNYRMVTGAENLSHHSYGMAIDINPLYNPYVLKLEKSTHVNPPSGSQYADRKQDFSYKITADDLCVQLFKSHGFGWGGDWESPKDYQHFEAYIPQN